MTHTKRRRAHIYIHILIIWEIYVLLVAGQCTDDYVATISQCWLACTHTYTQLHTHLQTATHTPTHSYTLTPTHTYTHLHTHTHVCTDAYGTERDTNECNKLPAPYIVIIDVIHPPVLFNLCEVMIIIIIIINHPVTAHCYHH